jgi:hypothetical protein
MGEPMFLGLFAGEEDLLAATRATRRAGYAIHDAFAPYAVHELNDAMGLKPSRLPWACLAFAVAGLSLAAFAQFWIGSIDWPLNVGGKPYNSLPAYLPVMFELTILTSGVGVVVTLLLRARLYPGKRGELPLRAVTDQRFVLAMEARDSSFNPAAIEELWKRFGVMEVKNIPETGKCSSC